MEASGERHAKISWYPEEGWREDIPVPGPIFSFFVGSGCKVWSTWATRRCGFCH